MDPNENFKGRVPAHSPPVILSPTIEIAPDDELSLIAVANLFPPKRSSSPLVSVLYVATLNLKYPDTLTVISISLVLSIVSLHACDRFNDLIRNSSSFNPPVEEEQEEEPR